MQALPAETIKIAPEFLEVANAYLECGSAPRTAETLGIPLDIVVDTLKRREVSGYIDRVFLDVGYNNKFLLRRAMDALIKKKFQELEESDTGSTKDIADLLLQSHKMSMDILDREIKLEQLRSTNQPQRQVNVQINELDGSKYAQLVQKLIAGDLE